jgi:hypothetical protein
LAADGASLHEKHFFGAVQDRADYASAVIEMFGSVMVKLCVFDAQHCCAHNETPHGNAHGELKRIDRLGASHDPAPYSQQSNVLP